MQSIQLLNYNEDTTKVEEEAKTSFLYTILERCLENTPVIDHIHAIYDNTDKPLTISKKMELRGILTTYNIMVIDGIDGVLRIFIDNEEIGRFEKPKYKIKTDQEESDPKKRIYLEMEINFWSSFDTEETQVE